MTQRHPIQNDQTLFITTVTRDRRPYFENTSLAREACEHIYRVQERKPFLLYGFVIMPDHVHLLLRVPSPETVSNVIRLYKMGLSFQTGLGPMWQRRFHAKTVDDIPSVQHYIHTNPVSGGLCATPDAYPWSSASGKWDVTEFGCI